MYSTKDHSEETTSPTSQSHGNYGSFQPREDTADEGDKKSTDARQGEEDNYRPTTYVEAHPKVGVSMIAYWLTEKFTFTCYALIAT